MLVVAMGVSACGKSTLGKALAARLGWRFLEGDDFHSRANIEKMSHHHPLNDADRAPWLAAMAAAIAKEMQADESVVLACSALKRRYRDVLRAAADGDALFLYMKIDRAAAEARLKARHGHFMPASLIDSQFADLEEPSADENAVTIDATASPRENLGQALRAVRALTSRSTP